MTVGLVGSNTFLLIQILVGGKKFAGKKEGIAQ